MGDDRYEKGLASSNRVIGPEMTEKLVNGFKDVCPDLSKLIIESVWCDLFTRPGLDLRTRELAAVSALSAIGTAAPQLRVHMHGALNAGCSPTEVTEVILQVIAFAGVPAAMNAMSVAKEVFKERGIEISE